MPHDTSAAVHHGQVCRCLRCPYHANVMNRFDAVSRTAHASAGCATIGANEGMVGERRRLRTRVRGSVHYRRCADAAGRATLAVARVVREARARGKDETEVRSEHREQLVVIREHSRVDLRAAVYRVVAVAQDAPRLPARRAAP